MEMLDLFITMQDNYARRDLNPLSAWLMSLSTLFKFEQNHKQLAVMLIKLSFGYWTELNKWLYCRIMNSSKLRCESESMAAKVLAIEIKLGALQWLLIITAYKNCLLIWILHGFTSCWAVKISEFCVGVFCLPLLISAPSEVLLFVIKTTQLLYKVRWCIHWCIQQCQIKKCQGKPWLLTCWNLKAFVIP